MTYYIKTFLRYDGEGNVPDQIGCIFKKNYKDITWVRT